jgi:signal transduction histidine kinase
VGRPLADHFRIVNEETRRPAVNPVDRVIREGIVVGLANHTVLIRPDGADVPIDDSAAPIRDANGQLLGVVLVFRDITERKNAERALFRWSTELERRVTERTEQLVRSQDRLRALAVELSRTEQRERRRLATNLHDYLAQLLALARIKIGQTKQGPDRVAATVQPTLTEIDTILQDCLRYTRTLMSQLSPAVLHDVGFVPAVQWLAEQMGQQGLNVAVEVLTPNMPRLSDSTADVLFQAVRDYCSMF